MKTLASLAPLAFLFLLACGNDVTGGNGGNGGTAGSANGGSGGATLGCATDADCGAQQVCGFPRSEACSAEGQCFPAPDAVCGAYSPGCACDGTTVSVICTGLPEGFVGKPLAYEGECGAPTDCCPADWMIYPCTYPGGESGFNCHNPQLKCPSSSECGGGCDTAVTGVCP